MRCRSDTHYKVVRRWSAFQRGRWWDDDRGEPSGDIKALECIFCDFQILKRNVARPRTSKSGLGRYNRMRAAMVQHLHEKHRDKLT